MTNRQQGGSGTFANDPERASDAGRKGAEQRQQTQESQSGGHQQGGSGNFANDRERASDAGRKGGQSGPDEKRSFSKDHDLASEAGRKGGSR